MIPQEKRKRKIIIICAVICGLILGAAGYVAFKLFGTEKFREDGIFQKASPQVEQVTNPLDGTKTTPDLAKRYPLAVMIENQTQARPHTGLDKASIVYEAVTEGGITRFMALFGPKDVKTVGPVRSIRTYFLDWAWEYQAYLAHVGGNIDALDRIETEKPYDLDEFSLGTKAYWREPEIGKAIEHTMYTNVEKLYSAAREKGFPTEADFRPLKFVSPEKVKANFLVTQEISIPFYASSYSVRYTYDPVNNNYPREMAGSPHRDRATGNQIAPTNLLIQSVERSETLTRINETGFTMKTIGQGKAIVLNGGQKIDATWEKTDLKSRSLFYDSSGKEISYPPGQFWYEIVPPDVFDKIKIETTEEKSET